MINEDVLKLSEAILDKHKIIRKSNIYELAFIYNFWSGKSNTLKVTKKNDDFIVFSYDMGAFDIEVCEDEACDCYFGCAFEESLKLLEDFIAAKIYEFEF